ncbi:MAG: DUF4139 domain-containing protein [Archangium sp.]|nr:DUF4139 domain-containing protein [Archangium sp.]
MNSLVLLTLAAAIEAPVTQVTVFTDQARVVRTAQVSVTGNQSLEFPPLRDTAEVASMRVEASGAEVKRVDIERIEPEKLRTEEAKQVLAEIEKVDVELDRLNQERTALSGVRDGLLRLSPAVPQGDPLKAPPKLSSGGWAQGAQFSADQLGKVQAKLREGERSQKKLNEKRAMLLDQARKLGNPQTTSGWKVVAQVSGNGPATLTLTYLVRGAQWTPTWDLQLQPDTNTVNLSLAGLVAQSSGEDWTNATLLLSTAIPSHAVKVPRLATWKIGVADRFIPTPTPVSSPVAPAPPYRPLAMARSEEDLVRGRLQRLGIAAVSRAPQGGPTPLEPDEQDFEESDARERNKEYSFDDDSLEGELARPQGYDAKTKDKSVRMDRPSAAPAAPPPPPPAPKRAAQRYAAESRVALSSMDVGEEESAPPVSTFSLAPPPAWRPPTFGADSPVTLAAGYDLSFASLQKETVPSERGSRRVALWSAQWPVSVERKLFPALTTDAFLVAELKNPSAQVLPGGPAQLYVGADPAGTARLKLVSPGEAFTLPLGIDRALKPVRNVQVVEATQGVFTKEEVGTYTVTIELANPYRAPVAVRVADQWPVTDQKDVETKLIESKPTAIQDAKKGSLEWRVTIAPQQKQVFSFTYTVKRPRGWKLQQQEVVR